MIRRNVLAGGSASKYPADNFFPTVAAWKAEFLGFDVSDYHLLPTSAYVGVGTDGRNLGADVDGVMAQAANALSGDDRMPPGTSQVRVTTSGLPDAMFNQAYAQTLACSGGSAPCAWMLVDASLPSGMTFDAAAAVVSGTPSAVETGTLTVMASRSDVTSQQQHHHADADRRCAAIRFLIAARTRKDKWDRRTRLRRPSVALSAP